MILRELSMTAMTNQPNLNVFQIDDDYFDTGFVPERVLECFKQNRQFKVSDVKESQENDHHLNPLLHLAYNNPLKMN